MTIIETFSSGKITGENTLPSHIVTAISNIFVFDNLAYKIYRNDSQFFNENFNDLSKKENRFSFTRKDFEWNNRLSPEIYTDLKGIKIGNNKISFVEPTDDADELVIVMNKIDMSDQVIRKLIDNKITINDCFEIGKQFGERIMKLPVPKIDLTAYADFQLRYKDLIAWIKSIKEIPPDIGERCLSFVKNFIESHKEELDTRDQMGLGLDVHADNAMYINGVYLPIDSYSPKEAWLQGYKNINIYRVATDMYVFLGKEAFDEVLRGYERSTGEEIPREYDNFMIIYCEIIMWPYQYMLSEKELWRLDVAKKHQEFVENILD